MKIDVDTFSLLKLQKALEKFSAECVSKDVLDPSLSPTKSGSDGVLKKLRDLEERISKITVLSIFPTESLRTFHSPSISHFHNVEELHLESCPPSVVLGLYDLRKKLKRISITNSGVSLLKSALIGDKHSSVQKILKVLWKINPIISDQINTTDFIPDDCKYSQLSTLSLHNCGLCQIDSSIHLLPNVTSIDFSKNDIANVIHFQDCYKLNILNLSYNRLRVLSNIGRVLGNVKDLNLSFNNIESLDGISNLYSLEVLDLSYNFVDDFNELDQLSNLPCLERINLFGNPISEASSYRFSVYIRLSQIRHNRFLPDLDGKPLDDEESLGRKGEIFRMPENGVDNSSSKNICYHLIDCCFINTSLKYYSKDVKKKMSTKVSFIKYSKILSHLYVPISEAFVSSNVAVSANTQLLSFESNSRIDWLDFIDQCRKDQMLIRMEQLLKDANNTNGECCNENRALSQDYQSSIRMFASNDNFYESKEQNMSSTDKTQNHDSLNDFRLSEITQSSLQSLGSEKDWTIRSTIHSDDIALSSPQRLRTDSTNLLKYNLVDRENRLKYCYVGSSEYDDLNVLENLELYFKEQIFANVDIRPSGKSAFIRKEAEIMFDFTEDYNIFVSPTTNKIETFESVFVQKIIDLSNEFNKKEYQRNKAIVGNSTSSEISILLVLTNVRLYLVAYESIDKASTFKDAPIPSAISYHDLVSLVRCSIFFGFQRCIFEFNKHSVNSESDTNNLTAKNDISNSTGSNNSCVYVVITRDKSSLHPLITKIPQLANAARNLEDIAVNKVKIYNKDADLLDCVYKILQQPLNQLGVKGIGTDPDIVHYQMLFQVSGGGSNNDLTPRSLILTPTLLLLCDEDLANENVKLKVVHSAEIKHILRIMNSTNEDKALDLVVKFKATSLFGKSKTWKLRTATVSAATRFQEDCEKLVLGYSNISVR